MSETSTQPPNKTILNKEYRWSTYSYIIDIISFTSLNILIILLMFMHRDLDSEVWINDWVFIVVGVILQLLAIFFSFLDSRRKNPKAKMLGSRIFNLPVFTITIIVIIAIFWGRGDAFAIVYGGICGGFAGYLAGGLAYANFFIKIKDEVYRTIFGGWIGVVLGAIMGSVFAYLVDPFYGEIFGGIFMGFWGGAIVSGPLATVLLFVLRNKTKFTQFFSKVLLFGTIREVSKDVKQYIAVDGNKTLDMTQCKVFGEREDKEMKPKNESDVKWWQKVLRVLFYIIFLSNPWEINQDKDRIEVFTMVFEFAAEKEGYTIDEKKIKT
jgi:MFS family permease